MMILEKNCETCVRDKATSHYCDNCRKNGVGMISQWRVRPSLENCEYYTKQIQQLQQQNQEMLGMLKNISSHERLADYRKEMLDALIAKMES